MYFTLPPCFLLVVSDRNLSNQHSIMNTRKLILSYTHPQNPAPQHKRTPLGSFDFAKLFKHYISKFMAALLYQREPLLTPSTRPKQHTTELTEDEEEGCNLIRYSMN